MNEVLRQIETRRSIRKYSSEPVPQEILDQIIKAGQIRSQRHGFESDWGKALLKSMGIEEEYEGIGHCTLGYAVGDEPKAAKRKENVYYLQ